MLGDRAIIEDACCGSEVSIAPYLAIIFSDVIRQACRSEVSIAPS